MKKNRESIHSNGEEMLPYPPSFVDRFMGWVKHFPIPYWLTYLVLFIIHVVINHVGSWVYGGEAAFTFNASVLTYPLWLWGSLAIMTYLDSIAVDALSNFGPLLDVPPEEMQRLKYKLTTMPARDIVISAFIWNCIYIIFSYLLYPVYVAMGWGTLAMIHAYLQGWITFLIGSAIFYHTFRQLRLVHRTVKSVEKFDLFRLEPIYAFSVLTSHTSLAWVLLIILTFLVQRVDFDPVVYLPFLSAGGMLALATFTLPLWVVHQRLVAEKRKLLSEHDLRVKSTLARLHLSADERDLSEVDQLNSLLEGLSTENRILQKIRTWPWSTETLAGFFSAIALPILLLLLQIIIQNWLNI